MGLLLRRGARVVLRAGLDDYAAKRPRWLPVDGRAVASQDIGDRQRASPGRLPSGATERPAHRDHPRRADGGWIPQVRDGGPSRFVLADAMPAWTKSPLPTRL